MCETYVTFEPSQYSSVPRVLLVQLLQLSGSCGVGCIYQLKTEKIEVIESFRGKSVGLCVQIARVPSGTAGSKLGGMPTDIGVHSQLR